MNNGELESLYSQIRAEEKASLARRIDAAFIKAPRLKFLDSERARLLSEVGLRRIDAATGKKLLWDIKCEEETILHSIGMSEDDLTLHYRCAICQDTGFLNNSRQQCSCRLMYRERLKKSDSINDREVFAKFRSDIFPTPEQKRNALNAKQVCEYYAQELPAPKKPNVFLLGMPGLGKTYLCNAIGYQAIANGIEAERVTAYSIVQTVMKDIRERTDYAFRYQNLPLLIIDDIGSEPTIPNVSNEWLFSIINERILATRATVLSSNFTLIQLQEKYGERFMSRLCDKNTTQLLQLIGNNLRINKQ
jgi:DNA replication protein DnaC